MCVDLISTECLVRLSIAPSVLSFSSLSANPYSEILVEVVYNKMIISVFIMAVINCIVLQIKHRSSETPCSLPCPEDSVILNVDYCTKIVFGIL